MIGWLLDEIEAALELVDLRTPHLRSQVANRFLNGLNSSDCLSVAATDYQLPPFTF